MTATATRHPGLSAPPVTSPPFGTPLDYAVINDDDDMAESTTWSPDPWSWGPVLMALGGAILLCWIFGG